MIVLGLDTATPLTAVALVDTDVPSSARETAHEPEPGERPGHARMLLPLAHELLAAAGLSFSEVERIVVGLGPGTFTGLRIGVATARALAQAGGADLVGVSTLQALAVGAEQDGGPPAVLAVVDAGRGEVFAAGYRGGEEVLAAVAIAPGQLGDLAGPGWLAVGTGAIRFRSEMQDAGSTVPPDSASRHRVSAVAVCRLATAVPRGPVQDSLVPRYLRPPDAVRRTPST